MKKISKSEINAMECCAPCRCGTGWLPPVIGSNGNWWINGIDTGIPVELPSIGCNGSWCIGNTDTGLSPVPVFGPPPIS